MIKKEKCNPSHNHFRTEIQRSSHVIPQDVNINEEMIKKQFAVHEVDVSSAADEHETGKS